MDIPFSGVEYSKLAKGVTKQGNTGSRIKSALTTKTAFTSPLYGVTNDHKNLPEGREEQGHPVTLVGGDTENVNGRGPCRTFWQKY